MKRNAQQRRRSIVENLREQGELSVEFFSDHYSTSEVTIRKDLAALEADGLVLRKHGSAILMPLERLETNSTVSKRKQRIAEMASALVKDHDRIVIDCGTTTTAMLPFFKAKRGLVVMTNSLEVANELLEMETEPTLIMTGGTWDKQSHSFQGAMAEQTVRSYNFDYAFIGAAGLDEARGTTTFNELTQLTRIMAETAEKVVVLAEAEKFDRKMPNLELPWELIDVLVTDASVSNEFIERLAQHDVEVLVSKE